ncbi:hypothetical protein, partial [Bacillus pumilus]|uniref:hypothetical protein n=1 Tax=Bacillus pumilus TaxID=1408 RepID=UPI001C92C1E2
AIHHLQQKSIAYLLQNQNLLKQQKLNTNNIIFKLNDPQTLQSPKNNIKTYPIQQNPLTSHSLTPFFKPIYLCHLPARQESAPNTLKPG